MEASVTTSNINDNIVSLDCLPSDLLLTLLKYRDRPSLGSIVPRCAPGSETSHTLTHCGLNIKSSRKALAVYQQVMTGENCESIELLVKTRVFRTEEQKVPPTAFEIIPLDEGCTIEPDTEQEGVASDDIVETPSQDGSFGNEEGEADSTQEADVEFDHMSGPMTQKSSGSIVFRRDGEDWSIVQSPADTGSQEEGELELKVDFGKAEDVDNFLMNL